MLKVVVFDSGYGGESFADLLEESVPILEVIRVIDWRNADKILSSAKTARKIAEAALRPYIGKVDLVIFANYLLTITSLKYFCHKYKNQKFIGLNLKKPDTFIKKDSIILATKAVARTITFKKFIFQLNRRIKTIPLDNWPDKIDDGELSETEIKNTLETFIPKDFNLQEIFLACSQFSDIKNELRRVFSHNLKIYDGFNDAIRDTCKTLKIRGSLPKSKN